MKKVIKSIIKIHKMSENTFDIYTDNCDNVQSIRYSMGKCTGCYYETSQCVYTSKTVPAVVPIKYNFPQKKSKTTRKENPVSTSRTTRTASSHTCSSRVVRKSPVKVSSTKRTPRTKPIVIK